jgi:GDP-L-fucose synthase
MNVYNESDIINVGSDSDISIKKLAEIIKDKIGYTGDIIWDTTKPNGTPIRKLSNEKLKKLGWESKINLNDGISKTIDWYLLNKANYDKN